MTSKARRFQGAYGGKREGCKGCLQLRFRARNTTQPEGHRSERVQPRELLLKSNFSSIPQRLHGCSPRRGDVWGTTTDTTLLGRRRATHRVGEATCGAQPPTRFWGTATEKL